MKMLRWMLAALLAVQSVLVLQADDFDDLARDFWNWRAAEMPVSTDDIPRLERPANFVPDWSPSAVESYRKQVSQFEKSWKAINASKWPVPRQVDYRLIGSAIARARWELDYLRAWKRNPNFYLDQTLGAYYHLLLQPPPFSAERSNNIVATLNRIPATLAAAEQNLTEPVRPFADIASAQLKDIRPRLTSSIGALKPLLDQESQRQIDIAAESAIHALEAYRDWLITYQPAMSAQTAIGPEGYTYF